MGIQINGQTDTVTAADGSLNLGGNVTIPGVLTYEDVTSVDAVGLSTFQNGIHVTGGSVGIGTDNPAAELEVYGNVRFKDIDGSHGIEFYPDVASLGYQRIISYNRTSTAYEDLSIGVNDFVVTTGSSSERLRITSSGSVGIGTDNPGVAGIDILANSAAVRCRESGGADARLVSGGSVSYFGTYSNHDLQILTDGSNALRITSDGNVGIGLTNPGALLSIPAGESNTPRFAIESAVDNNDFTITQYEDGNGTYTMLGQNVKLNSSGNNTILDSGHRTAGILLDARNHGAITFLTGDTNAGTENVKIDANGRVGVGTNFTPQKTLHLRDSNTSGVQGNTQLRIEKGVGQSAAPDSISRNNCYIHLGGSEWGDGSNGHYLIGFGYSNGEVGSAIPAYIGYKETTTAGYTNGDLIFGTRTSISGSDNPIERMRIHDNGYVEGHTHPIESGSTIRQQDGSGSGAATGWVAVNSTTWDWDVNQSHYISCTFEGYIQAGTYWWTWRLYNSTRSEVLTPFLGANRLDNTSGYGTIAYIGSVHSYSRQPYVAFKKSASTQTGDTIQLQLHASNSGGSILYTNASQTLYARYITFHAGVATGGSTL